MPERAPSFGYWLRRRRKALDLTQEALGRRVSCSGFSIRKIEADERRPSRRLAERLVAALAIPEAERQAFLASARQVFADANLPLRATPVPEQAGDATPFVGRRAEFSLLAGLLARISGGSGATVLLEGEPGIGKSRLMREVALHAQSLGLPTLANNCYEIERATPYQPVIELISRALGRASAVALGELSPVSLAELAALVPEIGERFPDLPRLSTDFPEARQARLSRAVAQLLEAVSGRRPSLLMIDDLQWADEASAQVLHYLARHAGERPVLLIFAYRGEDADNDERLARLIGSLRRDAAAHLLPLARLDYDAAQDLVAAYGAAVDGAADLAAQLHSESAGNPFFLISILQALREGGRMREPGTGAAPAFLPDALRAAVRARLAHVPGAHRAALEAAAVIGRRFEFDTLLAVMRLDEGPLLEALESLVRRRVLHEEAATGNFDFTHDKLREVVYSDLGGARRRLLHRAVAEALEQRGAGEDHERHAQLAEHYERAGVWLQALDYLLLAAERSQALFAMGDALRWLDRAVAMAEAHPRGLAPLRRLQIYERRGVVRAQAGQTQGAVADIRLVVDAMRTAGERARTCDALVQLGMAYRRADAYEEAARCLAEALQEAEALHDVHRAADTLYHLGTVAWSNGLNDQAIRYHGQAVAICKREAFTDLVGVQAYHGHGEACYSNAQPLAAIDCFTRSLELARAIHDKGYECENLMMIGHACVGTRGLGDYARAVQHFEAALQIARTADLQWHMGPTLLGLDHARACTGQYGAAWTGLQATLAWLEGLKQSRYQLIACDFLGHLLLDLGMHELALAQLERGLALGRDTGIQFWVAALHAHRAVARSRLGEPGMAAALEATLAQARGAAERLAVIRCLEGLAEIALRDGDALRCHAHGDELLSLALDNGLREVEAVARRWRGEALIALGDPAHALVELSLAATQAAAVGRVRLRLDIATALAQLHAVQGHPAEAVSHGATARTLAEAISQSLASSGLRPGELVRAVGGTAG